MKKNINIVTGKLLKYKVNLVLGIITMILFAIFSGATITLLAPIFDYVFTNLDRQIEYATMGEISDAIIESTTNSIKTVDFNIFKKESFTPFLDGYKDVLAVSHPLQLLYLVVIVIIIALILKNIFYVANRYFFSVLKAKTVRDIRNEIFESYLSQSIAFFNKNKVGDSIVRMVDDVNMISNLYISSIFNVLRDFVSIIMFIFIALFINAKLFFLSLLIVPIFTFAVNFLGKKIKKYAKRIQKQASTLFSNIEEVLSSMKIVKAFSREEYEADRMAEINNTYMKHRVKSYIYASLNAPLSEMTSMATGIIVIILGAQMITSDSTSFSLGSFTAFLGAVFSMLHPLKVLTKAYTDIKKASVSLGRIAEVVNVKPDIVEKDDALSLKEFKQGIEIKDVSFRYVEGKDVINNVTLSIKKGESVGLVGSSGSGKSTLINLVNRMYDYNSGKINIDGIDIKDLKLHDLRSLFGLVTQDSILFSDTIANNIRYGTSKQLTMDEIKTAADIAYAKEFIEDITDGFEHKLETKGSDLSGGQKQRICIARAIVGNPPILIFDEATSALDTDSEKNVQIAIEKATKNRTVIMIAHRLSTIINCDKIVVMDKGEIVGVGKHKELLKTCSRYAELYNLQYRNAQ
jgi:subfamily B ATP-binding cassette protein MsbA